MRVNWARRLQYLFLSSEGESKVNCTPSDDVGFPTVELLKDEDPFCTVLETSEKEKSDMNAQIIAEWEKDTLFGMSRTPIEGFRTLSLHFFPQIADFSSKSLRMTSADINKVLGENVSVPSTSTSTKEIENVQRRKIVESEDKDDCDIIILDVINKHSESSLTGKKNQSCSVSMIELHNVNNCSIHMNMDTPPVITSTHLADHFPNTFGSRIFLSPIMNYVPNIHLDEVFRAQVKAQVAHFNAICNTAESHDFITTLKDRLAHKKKSLIDIMDRLEIDIANTDLDSTLEQFKELFSRTLEKIKCEKINRSDISIWCDSFHIYYPNCPEVVPVEGFLSLDEALRKKFQMQSIGTTRNIMDPFNHLSMEKNSDDLPVVVHPNKPEIINHQEKLINSSSNVNSSNQDVSSFQNNDCFPMMIPRLKVRLQRDSTGNCSEAQVLSTKGEGPVATFENLMDKREEKFPLECKNKHGSIEKDKEQSGEIQKNDGLWGLQCNVEKNLSGGKDVVENQNEMDKLAESPLNLPELVILSTCANSENVNITTEKAQNGVVSSLEDVSTLSENTNTVNHIIDMRYEGNQMRINLGSPSVSTINIESYGSDKLHGFANLDRASEEQLNTNETLNDDLSEVMMDVVYSDDDGGILRNNVEEILNNALVKETILQSDILTQIPILNRELSNSNVPTILAGFKLEKNYTGNTIDTQKTPASAENGRTVITFCADLNIEDELNNDVDERETDIDSSHIRFSPSEDDILELSDDEDPFICCAQALYGKDILPTRVDLSPVDDEDPFDIITGKRKSSSSETIKFIDENEMECIDSLDEVDSYLDTSSIFVPWKIIPLTLEKKNTKTNYSIWNIPVHNPVEISNKLRQRVRLRNNNPLNIALATQTHCVDEVPLKRIRLADYNSDPSTCILRGFEKYEAVTASMRKDLLDRRPLYDPLSISPVQLELIKEKLLFSKLIREPKQYEQKVLNADTQVKLNREPILTSLEEELIRNQEIPEWGNVNPKRFEYPFSPTAGMYWPIIQPMDAVDVDEDKCVQLADVCNQLPCHTAYSFGTKSDLLCNLQPNQHRDRYNRTINMSFDQLKQSGRFRNRIGYQRKFTSQTISEAREADSKLQKAEAAWIKKMLDTKILKTREVDDEREQIILQTESQCRSYFMEAHIDFNITDKYSKKCDSQKGTREDLQVPRSWLEVPRHIYVSTNDRRGFLCTMVNFHNKTCLKLQPNGGEFSNDELIKWQSNAINVIFLHQRGMLPYCNKGMLSDSDQILANKRTEEIKRVMCANRVSLADLDRLCRLAEWEKKYWPILWDNLVSIFSLFPPVSQLRLQPHIDRAFTIAAQLCDRVKFHERYQEFKNNAAAYNQ